MVDVTEMHLKIKHDPKWFKTISIKLELVKTNANGKFGYYEGKLFFHDDKSLTDFDEKRFLRITLSKGINYIQITIHKSIQDWYLSKNTCEDFSKSSFGDCISLLSEKLSVAKTHLLKATIMDLTWKAKIVFREVHHNFMNCIFEHKTLKNKYTIGKTRIEFRGKDKSLIINKIPNKHLIDGEQRNDFYIQFELRATNLSNDSYLDDKGRCPKDISNNWNEVIEEWKNQLNNLIIVDSFSPKISDYLKNSNMTKMNGYLIYVGIKHYGLENFRQLINDKMISKKLYEYRKKYIEIYEKFEDANTPNYRSYFKTNVELIAEKLKK